MHNHHHHHHEHAKGRAFALVLLLNVSLLIVEAIVGFMTGSLALLADAAHMLSDVSALSIAWIANKIGRNSDSRKAEIIGATINGLALLGAAIFIILEGAEKFGGGSLPAMGWPVLLVALVGLAVNILSYKILTRSPSRDLNIKGAISHMFADALASIGAIIAGLFIMFGFPLADAVIAIVIGLVVVWTALDVLKDCIKVVLHGSWNKESTCEKGCCCGEA